MVYVFSLNGVSSISTKFHACNMKCTIISLLHWITASHETVEILNKIEISIFFLNLNPASTGMILLAFHQTFTAVMTSYYNRAIKPQEYFQCGLTTLLAVPELPVLIFTYCPFETSSESTWFYCYLLLCEPLNCTSHKVERVWRKICLVNFLFYFQKLHWTAICNAGSSDRALTYPDTLSDRPVGRAPDTVSHPMCGPAFPHRFPPALVPHC